MTKEEGGVPLASQYAPAAVSLRTFSSNAFSRAMLMTRSSKTSSGVTTCNSRGKVMVGSSLDDDEEEDDEEDDCLDDDDPPPPPAAAAARAFRRGTGWAGSASHSSNIRTMDGRAMKGESHVSSTGPPFEDEDDELLAPRMPAAAAPPPAAAFKLTIS